MIVFILCMIAGLWLAVWALGYCVTQSERKVRDLRDDLAQARKEIKQAERRWRAEQAEREMGSEDDPTSCRGCPSLRKGSSTCFCHLNGKVLDQTALPPEWCPKKRRS